MKAIYDDQVERIGNRQRVRASHGKRGWRNGRERESERETEREGARRKM